MTTWDRPNRPPAGKFLDSAHSSKIEKIVADKFGHLYYRERARVTAYVLQSQLLDASTRTSLCSHARRLLISGRFGISVLELAWASSLTDDEFLHRYLGLRVDGTERRNYGVAVEFLSKDLFLDRDTQSVSESDTASLQIMTGTRTALRDVIRSILIRQIQPIIKRKLSSSGFQDDFLETDRAAALAVGATLCRDFPELLAGAMKHSFRKDNRVILKHLCLDETEEIMQSLAEAILTFYASCIVDSYVDSDADSDADSDTDSDADSGVDSPAADKRPWLTELKQLNASEEYVRKLLTDEQNACPWIFSEDRPSIPRVPLFDKHINGCVHSHLSTSEEESANRISPPPEAHPVIGRSKKPTRPISIGSVEQGSLPREDIIVSGSNSSCFQNGDIVASLHQRCGLAGVLPVSVKDGVGNSLVTFKNNNAAAVVCFAVGRFLTQVNYQQIIGRIIAALEGLCSAFAEAQEQNFCCNLYTILCVKNLTDPTSIEAFRIHIQVAWQLLEDLRELSSMLPDWGKVRTSKVFSKLLSESGPLNRILKPLCCNLKSFLEGDPELRTPTCLHYCSLAAQFLSLAFLSYCQAHKSGLLPSFLLAPLQKVVLAGIGMAGAPVIEMATRPLTCIGDMLGAPVMSFRLLTGQPHSKPASTLKYDIYANVADIVDTWGPAELICVSSEQKPFAIQIGGGILWTDNTSDTQYHWGATPETQNISRKEIDLTGKLQVGAVHLNQVCESRIQELRDRSVLGTLGTKELKKSVKLESFGISFGEVFRFTTQTSCKLVPGKSVKQVDEERARGDVLSLLEDWSAVQVSFCTGICRRVRFRDMVADLLPDFGPHTVRACQDLQLWHKLLRTELISHLTGKGAIELDAELASLFKNKVEELHATLVHSGIDNEEKLRVAWPSAKTRLAYRSIACEGQNSWIHLLSESTDISSYTYVAPHCLQAAGNCNYKCLGGWSEAQLSNVPVFATKVQCLAESPISELPDQSMCYFQTLHKIVFVQVCRPSITGAPRLQVVLTTAPNSVRRRILARWPWGGNSNRIQLRESLSGEGYQTEDVLIECSENT